jgi:hypothetical protein
MKKEIEKQHLIDMMIGDENLLLYKTEQMNVGDVSGSVIVENEQVVLYFQFNDDEPIEGLKCNGKKFTMEIHPVENNFVRFTDGKNTMKLFVRNGL